MRNRRSRPQGRGNNEHLRSHSCKVAWLCRTVASPLRHVATTRRTVCAEQRTGLGGRRCLNARQAHPGECSHALACYDGVIMKGGAALVNDLAGKACRERTSLMARPAGASESSARNCNHNCNQLAGRGSATTRTRRSGGSPIWTRTRNLPVNSRSLCQLSYGGPCVGPRPTTAPRLAQVLLAAASREPGDNTGNRRVDDRQRGG